MPWRDALCPSDTSDTSENSDSGALVQSPCLREQGLCGQCLREQDLCKKGLREKGLRE